jgi:hypothetical protein
LPIAARNALRASEMLSFTGIFAKSKAARNALMVSEMSSHIEIFSKKLCQMPSGIWKSHTLIGAGGFYDYIG